MYLCLQQIFVTKFLLTFYKEVHHITYETPLIQTSQFNSLVFMLM